MYRKRYITIGILVLATILRVINLDYRVPHHDEGGNFHHVEDVIEEGFYTYRSNLYHGPLYFYILAIWELITKDGITGSRFITATISIGIILLLLFNRNRIPDKSNIIITLIAVSPGFIFYGRYSIHETLFILFQLIFTIGLIDHFEHKKNSLSLFIGLVGLLLTKETFIIFLAAILFAAVIIYKKEVFYLFKPNRKKVIYAGLSLLVLIVFYTGFFNNVDGFMDMLQSLTPWINTGIGDTQHHQPFYYWFYLILNYELYIIPIIILAPLLYKKMDKKYKMLTIFAYMNLLIYSSIPYKTPWLVLNILWPFIILIPILIKNLNQFRIVTIALSACLIVITSYKSISLNYFNMNSINEPYVYSPTHTDLQKFVNNLDDRYDTVIYIYTKKDWPIGGLLYRYIETYFFRGDLSTIYSGADVYVIDFNDELKFDTAINPNNYIKVYGRYAYYYNDVIFYYSKKVFKNLKL